MPGSTALQPIIFFSHAAIIPERHKFLALIISFRLWTVRMSRDLCMHNRILGSGLTVTGRYDICVHVFCHLGLTIPKSCGGRPKECSARSRKRGGNHGRPGCVVSYTVRCCTYVIDWSRDGSILTVSGGIPMTCLPNNAYARNRETRSDSLTVQSRPVSKNCRCKSSCPKLHASRPAD